MMKQIHVQFHSIFLRPMFSHPESHQGMLSTVAHEMDVSPFLATSRLKKNTWRISMGTKPPRLEFNHNSVGALWKTSQLREIHALSNSVSSWAYVVLGFSPLPWKIQQKKHVPKPCIFGLKRRFCYFITLSCWLLIGCYLALAKKTVCRHHYPGCDWAYS